MTTLFISLTIKLFFLLTVFSLSSNFQNFLNFVS